MIEKLIELLLNGENVNITYSNIDGKESLVVNGEDFLKSNDDDIKSEVQSFKEIMDKIDSCTLSDACDLMKEHFCLKDFDEMLNLEHYSEDEADTTMEMITVAKECIEEVILSRIETLNNVLRNL